MAGGTGSGFKIVLLLLLIVLIFMGGLLWFDYLGLINVKERFTPVLSLVGIPVPKKIENTGDLLLLEKERLKKQVEALAIRTETLNKREQTIVKKENEINEKVETLNEQGKALEEKEKSFNEREKEYENRDKNLRQASKYFVGMPPKDAVARLLKMDDQNIIDILRVSEKMAQEAGTDSIVSYWLSLMPADRVADINRKMIKKP